jgi:hypothetical protein
VKIVHPASADTHTLVWIFHDDEERRMYLSTAKNRDVGFVGLIILGFMLLGTIIGMFAGNGAMLFCFIPLGIPFIAQFHRVLVAVRYPLTTLRVQCRPGSVRMTENYGEANRWRDRVVFDRAVSTFKSATWVAGGCFLEHKGVIAGVRGVTLPMRLFSSAAAIEGFMSWAAAHGLAVEGVPPLPGAYERPIEDSQR